MKKLFYLTSLCLSASLLVFTGCDDDDPPPAENEEEVIDLVRLSFTEAGSTTPIVVAATDDDGEGPNDFVPEVINLKENTTYTLRIEVRNEEEGENVTEEIQNEATAHQFFFAWTGQIFTQPTGLGNYADDGGLGPFGNVNGLVQYTDDELDYQSEPDDDGVAPRDNVPVGLETVWETASATTEAEIFRVVLKHQPGVKTATTNSNDGDTDIDIPFTINITQ